MIGDRTNPGGNADSGGTTEDWREADDVDVSVGVVRQVEGFEVAVLAERGEQRLAGKWMVLWSRIGERPMKAWTEDLTSACVLWSGPLWIRGIGDQRAGKAHCVATYPYDLPVSSFNVLSELDLHRGCQIARCSLAISA